MAKTKRNMVTSSSESVEAGATSLQKRENRTLLQIADDILALEAALVEAEGELVGIGNQSLERWFDEIGAERDTKLDGYVSLIRELEGRAAIRQEEATRLENLARIDKNLATRLKARLLLFFQITETTRVETRRYRITRAANGGLAPLIINPHVDVRSVDQRFWKVEFDTKAIREALDNKEELSFARLGERGEGLRIK